MSKPIVMSFGGWTNPESDRKCGPEDPNSTHMEPVHIGGCKTCRSVIVALLKARYPQPEKVEEPEQKRFEW